jgi:hypothetical protein
VLYLFGMIFTFPLLFSNLFGLLQRFSIKALKQFDPLRLERLAVLLKLLFPLESLREALDT